jgi:hypothetical protein
MHWLINYVFGSHVADWVAFVFMVLLVLVVRICTRRFVLRMLSRKRDPDKSEREYWRVHGGE